MSEKKTTVREIAREANVSIATVSRFLNQDYSGMSEDTKQRLAVTVETLGYVNPRAKQNRTAALVLPGIADPFSLHWWRRSPPRWSGRDSRCSCV